MMGMKTIRLTEKETIILRDICFARMKVLHAGDQSFIEELQKNTEFTEMTVRQALPAFDFFQCAYYGNEEGTKRQANAWRSFGAHAGGGYYDGMTSDYQKIMADLMGEKYSPDDVKMLQDRMKGFVKSLKAAPARTLYIADCHFYHDRICREMDNRGFSGFEEMNEHMIAQWNARVTSRDDVYIIGDFCITRGDAAERILDRLNGKLHLIIGNHDKYLEDKHFEAWHWFRSVEHYQEIRDNGRTVILSHYPVFCYKGQYRRDRQGNPITYMLYGHVHNTHDEVLINRFIMETRATLAKSRHADQPEPIPCNMINCFCMFSNYQPMTLDEWIVTDRKRRAGMLAIGAAEEINTGVLLHGNKA